MEPMEILDSYEYGDIILTLRRDDADSYFWVLQFGLNEATSWETGVFGKIGVNQILPCCLLESYKDLDLQFNSAAFEAVHTYQTVMNPGQPPEHYDHNIYMMLKSIINNKF